MVGYTKQNKQKQRRKGRNHSQRTKTKDEVTLFTISLKILECSHLDASPPPAKGLGADIGGDEVAVAHSPRSAEEVRQAVSHAGCRVAGSLLCCNAASGEQTRG